jgi:anti-repressor protein
VSTEITPFAFPATGQPVRTVTVDGRIRFVGKDAATILGHTNPARAVRDHVPAGHRWVTELVTPSDLDLDPQTVLIDEAGLYRLIMRSNTVLADQFQEWVTAEVLPAIRSTGSYGPPAVRMPDLTTPEGVLVLAEQFATTARQLVAADERIRELEPKAVAHDQFLTADAGDRLIREVAKLIGWKQRDLRIFLMEEKLIFHRQAPCGAHQYDVYAAHARHFKPVETTVEHTWGSCNHYTLYVKPSGVDLIQRRIVRHREAVAGA